MTPSVSVVMPVGSVCEYLPVQLAALARQDYSSDWELVLSLNTSDEDEKTRLAAVVAEAVESGLPSDYLKVVDSSLIRSAAHARNVGAAESSAPLLAFCDSDDIADPAWLTGIVKALQDHEAVGGFLDEELLAIPAQAGWRPPATPSDNPSYLGFKFLVSANMGIRKLVFEETGGFDTSLSRCEDIAFGWELIRLGYEPGFVADASMAYRHRSGLKNMLRQHFLYGIGMSEVLSRHEVPSQDGTTPGMFAANGQVVDRKGLVHFMRRASIATGRLVGLGRESKLWSRLVSTPSRAKK